MTQEHDDMSAFTPTRRNVMALGAGLALPGFARAQT